MPTIEFRGPTENNVQSQYAGWLKTKSAKVTYKAHPIEPVAIEARHVGFSHGRIGPPPDQFRLLVEYALKPPKAKPKTKRKLKPKKRPRAKK
jgi:hypothetical protein